MFNVSALEILVVLIVALLVFGPARLPGLAKNLGTWAHQSRLAFNRIKSELNKAIAPESSPKKDTAEHEPRRPS